MQNNARDTCLQDGVHQGLILQTWELRAAAFGAFP